MDDQADYLLIKWTGGVDLCSFGLMAANPLVGVRKGRKMDCLEEIVNGLGFDASLVPSIAESLPNPQHDYSRRL